MTTFSISASALHEIHRIFNGSSCKEPIADLYEYTSLGTGFNDLNAQFLEKKLSPEKMKESVEERLLRLQDELPSSLRVTVKERTELPADLPPNYLCTVSGVTFLMFHNLAKMLSDYRLIFEGGEFSFEGPDNIRHTSLEKLANASNLK